MDRPPVNSDAEARDILVMDLVESALARPVEQRRQYLETVRSLYPALHAEVRERVEWEERMEGFLREPIIRARPDNPDRPFAPDEIVAGRFRILRELGRGGMGVVYEAADEKLDRRIAIKCARREFQSRLTPEARAALEVSHPNVCKLHELHTAQTAAGPVDFLTMEFIEGETLFQRLEREGALTQPQAREIALQICAGLAQAHRQGVVHGDIKSANVILSRTPEGGARAVVTDFGLSELLVERSLRSGEKAAAGTFAYMAPELFSGSRSTVSSDIYALGMLFHFMLTGKVIDRRPPDAPVSVDLPSPWKRIVRRCIEVKPEDRFATVDDVIALLTRRRAVLTWALAAAVVTIMILALVLWRSRQDTGPPVRLVVLPVTVEGAPIPSASGLGTDVADRLSGARRNFTVIGPQEALRNRVETAEKAKSVLGATHVLRTSLQLTGTNISAVAVISDAASGQPLRELKGEYPAAQTMLIAKALIATVTGALGLRSRLPAEPTSGPAYQDYVEGVALLRRDGQSADEAIPHFTRATQLDPQSALPYAGLAEAQIQKSERGGGSQWLDLAAATLAKAKSLNPDAVPVLLASGLWQQSRGRYEQAITAYTRATHLEPQNAYAWGRLAIAYERSNRTDEAIATYQKAIAAQPDFYMHYLSFGTFYLRRGQYLQAEGLYRHATVVAPSMSDGHMNLGLALMQQGKFQDSERELLASLRLNRNAQNLMNIGALYYAQKRYPEAIRFFAESIAVGPGTTLRYIDLADGYRSLGRSKEALDAYRQGRVIAERDVARNPRDGNSRALLALLAARLGDVREAGFEISQALTLQPENAMVMRNAAVTYEVLHQREKALEVLRSAPAYVLEDLNRYPDTKDLSRDLRFQAMMPKISIQ